MYKKFYAQKVAQNGDISLASSTFQKFTVSLEKKPWHKLPSLVTLPITCCNQAPLKVSRRKLVIDLFTCFVNKTRGGGALKTLSSQLFKTKIKY